MKNLHEAAIRILVREQTVSISLLQRHLRLGYGAALNLMDDLEKNGVVTPPYSTAKRTLAAEFRRTEHAERDAG